jgi:hypothetical protein
MVNTQTQQPLDKRSKKAHPERIEVGDEVFVRQDILAAKFGISERSMNRGDAEGAPYRYIAAVKYRPERRYESFFLSGIKENKPQQPRATRRRAR